MTSSTLWVTGFALVGVVTGVSSRFGKQGLFQGIVCRERHGRRRRSLFEGQAQGTAGRFQRPPAAQGTWKYNRRVFRAAAAQARRCPTGFHASRRRAFPGTAAMSIRRRECDVA